MRKGDTGDDEHAGSNTIETRHRHRSPPAWSASVPFHSSSLALISPRELALVQLVCECCHSRDTDVASTTGVVDEKRRHITSGGIVLPACDRTGACGAPTCAATHIET